MLLPGFVGRSRLLSLLLLGWEGKFAALPMMVGTPRSLLAQAVGVLVAQGPVDSEESILPCCLASPG